MRYYRKRERSIYIVHISSFLSHTYVQILLVFPPHGLHPHLMPQALAGSSWGGVVMADKVMRWHLDLPSDPSLVRKLQPAVPESPFRLSSTIPSFRINPTDTNAEFIAFQERLVATQNITPRPRSQSSLIQIGPGSTGAREQSNIDPAISGTTMLSPPDHSPTATGPGGEVSPQEPGSSQEPRKTYGKRELSTSKRAAQNRAAQVRKPPSTPTLALPLGFIGSPLTALG